MTEIKRNEAEAIVEIVKNSKLWQRIGVLNFKKSFYVNQTNYWYDEKSQQWCRDESENPDFIIPTEFVPLSDEEVIQNLTSNDEIEVLILQRGANTSTLTLCLCT